MHIIFDARYIRTDHHDGISRFSAELLQGLAPLCSQAGDTLSALIHDDGLSAAQCTAHLFSSAYQPKRATVGAATKHLPARYRIFTNANHW